MKRICMFVFILSVLFVPNVVFANEIDENGVVGYSVSAILPDNQLNQDATYFDLRMKPNQQQAIQVKVFNSSKETIKVKPTIHNAETNRNGIIDYSGDPKQIDSSLKIPLTSIVKLKNEVITIPKGEQKIIEADINMPSDTFHGIILGGIHFEKVTDEEADADAEQGVQIQNKYAYVVGIQLSETDKSIQPNLKLIDISPTLVNYRTSVVAKIQNEKPTIIGELAIDAKVFKQGSQTPIHETNQTDLKMAPNSTMDYVIDWDNQRLEPGKYRLEMAAKSKDKTWKWKENFEIESDSAADANKEAVDLEKDYTMWYMIGIGAALVIIIILVIIILRMRRKQQTPE